MKRLTAQQIGDLKNKSLRLKKSSVGVDFVAALNHGFVLVHHQNDRVDRVHHVRRLQVKDGDSWMDMEYALIDDGQVKQLIERIAMAVNDSEEA